MSVQDGTDGTRTPRTNAPTYRLHTPTGQVVVATARPVGWTGSAVSGERRRTLRCTRPGRRIADRQAQAYRAGPVGERVVRPG